MSRLHVTGLVLLVLSTLASIACVDRMTHRISETESNTASVPGLTLTPVIRGLRYPVAMLPIGDDGAMLIAEQGGLIRRYPGPNQPPELFLDISAKVNCCGESGLLGMALHPDDVNHGWLFVNYTDRDGTTVIERYSFTGRDAVDRNSAVLVLRIRQPTPIHNGGNIAFGPDGYLYIGMGDGGSFSSTPDGSGGDPRNRAQNNSDLLGKLLRIDVDHGTPHAIPGDNPFVNDSAAKAAIWASGLKNPWRFSFDRDTGDLYIADVGHAQWEEINFQSASSRGGENYGWRRMEGPACFNANRCEKADLTLPVLYYDHDEGCAVIGGYVYRGRAYPFMTGAYLYGDYCSGRIWAGRRDLQGRWASGLLAKTKLSISAFAEDKDGELYVFHRGDGDGVLYRMDFIEAASAQRSGSSR